MSANRKCITYSSSFILTHFIALFAPEHLSCSKAYAYLRLGRTNQFSSYFHPCADFQEINRDENSESSTIYQRSGRKEGPLTASEGLIKTKVYPTESKYKHNSYKKVHTQHWLSIYHDQPRHKRIEERPEIRGRRGSCRRSKFRSTCKTIGWICWDSIAAGKKLHRRMHVCVT